MKNKSISRKLINALAIGLSASMAMQPITAFAGEPETEPVREDENNHQVQGTDETYSQVTESVESAGEEVIKAGSSVDAAAGDAAENYQEAKEALTEAKEDVADAQEQVAVALEADKKAIEDEQQINQNIDVVDEKTDAAVDSYENAGVEAQNAVFISDKIDTEKTDEATAKEIVEEVQSSADKAAESYSEAEQLLDEAQKAYDEAEERYNDLVSNSQAAEDAIIAAKQDLENAGKVLEDAQKSVHDAEDEAYDKYYKAYDNGYQEIIEAKEYLSTLTPDDEEYEERLEKLTQLIIKNHLLNGVDATDIRFNEVVHGYLTGYEKDENGNYIKGEDGNFKKIVTRVPLKVFSYVVDGERVFKNYDYTLNEEGVLSITEKNVEVTGRDEITLQEEAEGYYTTEDGEKTFTGSDTVHTVSVDPEDATKGFYAIDTSDKESIVTTLDLTPKDSEEARYKEVPGTEERTYEEAVEHVVVDEYNKKQQLVDKRADVIPEDIDGEIASFIDKGYSLKVYCIDTFSADKIFIDTIDEWNEYKAGAKNFGRFSYFAVYAYETVDDLESPKVTHTETGIYETVTKEYEVTRPEYFYASGEDYVGPPHYGSMLDAANAARAALDAIDRHFKGISTDEVKYEMISRKFDMVYNVTGISSWGYKIWYDVKVTKYNTTTERLVSSKTLYDATDYTNYVAPKEEVKDTVVSINTHRTELASTTDESFINAVSAQKSAFARADEARERANQARLDYDEAVEAVRTAREKLHTLNGTGVPAYSIKLAQQELKVALAELQAAREKRSIAQDSLKEAEDALATAKTKLAAISSKNMKTETAKAEEENNQPQQAVVPVSVDTAKAEAVTVTAMSGLSDVTTANVISSDIASAAVDTETFKTQPVTAPVDQAVEMREHEAEDVYEDVTASYNIVDDMNPLAASIHDNAEDSEEHHHLPWFLLVVLAAAGVISWREVRRKSA